jgi:hypothetical protein
MKIQSRPEEAVAGSGEFTLRMSFEELQLIGTLMYITRLGVGSVYKQAAAKLLDTITEIFDDDFFDESAMDVDLHISITSDEDDDIIGQYPCANVIIEV